MERNYTDKHLCFLGVLGYPKESELKKVAAFMFAVNSELFKGLANHYKTKIPKPFNSIEKRKAERQINHLVERRLPRRMQAAAIALYPINKWMPTLNKAVENIQILSNKMMGEPIFPRYSKDEQKSNIYRTTWTESKPVLHMALALFPIIHYEFFENKKITNLKLLEQIKQKKVKKLYIKDLLLFSYEAKCKYKIDDMTDLINNPAWFSKIVEIAEAWAIILPKFIPSINKKDLIKLF